MTDDKVRENRLRRMAARQGLTLSRSRRRDPRALDYGLYWLTETTTDKPRSPQAGVNIDEIEELLVAPMN